MSDEPTNGELARRQDEILRALAGLIGQPQYIADQRRYDDRFDTLRRDLAEERRDREESERQVHQRITDEMKRQADSKLSWRTIIYTGLVPALVVLISILVEVWMHGGGK